MAIRIPTITPLKNKSGSIYLRFRLNYREYEFTLPLKWDDRRDRTKAEAIADIIREDIKHDALGLQPPAFDPTLNKYRPNSLKVPEPINHHVPDLLQTWLKFVEFKVNEGKIAETTLQNSYQKSEKVLEKVQRHNPTLLNPDKSSEFYDYLCKSYKPSTLKLYYTNWVACANWATKRKIWPENPYQETLANLSNHYSPNTGKAYSDSEATVILNAIATDRFTSPRALVKHSYYAQFLKFLFLTGVRPQLAIALEWEQIIWELDRPVKIYFDRAFTDGILKPSKGDRSGKNISRILPVNSELATLIESIPKRETIQREPRISRHLKSVTQPHYPNLVFPSSRHWYIEIDNFTENIFRPIVKSLVEAGEVNEYLPTYHARHTTQNRWLESGMSEETIAALLDTSPEIIRKHYRNDQRYRENLAENITLPEMEK